MGRGRGGLSKRVAFPSFSRNWSTTRKGGEFWGKSRSQSYGGGPGLCKWRRPESQSKEGQKKPMNPRPGEGPALIEIGQIAALTRNPGSGGFCSSEGTTNVKEGGGNSVIVTCHSRESRCSWGELTYSYESGQMELESWEGQFGTRGSTNLQKMDWGIG